MQDRRFAGATAFLIALSVSADEAIWFSGPDFCEGICASSPPGSEPVPLNRSIKSSIKQKVGNVTPKVGSFDLSPDGQHIAFMRVSGVYGYHDVWIMDSDGNNPRELVAQVRQGCEINTSSQEVCSSNTPYFGWGVTWSSDGLEILYDDLLYPPGFQVINLEGSSTGNIELGKDFYAASWSYPHWSHTGYISYTNVSYSNYEHNLRIIDREGNINHEFDIEGLDPQLSPDASKLSFYIRTNRNLCCIDSSEIYQDSLFVFDIVNKKQQFIGHGTRHSWSPDGQRIAYYEYFGEGHNGFIKAVNIDGTNQVVLLEFPSPPSVDGPPYLPFFSDIEWISVVSTKPSGISPATWGQVKDSIE